MAQLDSLQYRIERHICRQYRLINFTMILLIALSSLLLILLNFAYILWLLLFCLFLYSPIVKTVIKYMKIDNQLELASSISIHKFILLKRIKINIKEPINNA